MPLTWSNMFHSIACLQDEATANQLFTVRRCMKVSLIFSREQRSFKLQFLDWPLDANPPKTTVIVLKS